VNVAACPCTITIGTFTLTCERVHKNARRPHERHEAVRVLATRDGQLIVRWTEYLDVERLMSGVAEGSG